MAYNHQVDVAETATNKIENMVNRVLERIQTSNSRLAASLSQLHGAWPTSAETAGAEKGSDMMGRLERIERLLLRIESELDATADLVSRVEAI